MTLATALDALGWSAREMARRLGCSQNLPLAWMSGRATCPPDVLAWVRDLAQHVERHPPPDNWRTQSAA